MRIPPQQSDRPRSRRRTIVLLALIATVVVIIVVGSALSGFYANFLWFHSSGVGDVWSTMELTKILLTLVFIVAAFALVFVCLTLVDKVVARTLFLAPDTELVRRYQTVVAPHALVLRIGVSVLVGLALGSGASSQWEHWLLFEHSVPFKGQVDPIFGRNAAFFVFRLPFLSFLVDWMFGALVVAFIVTAIAYFLNGAIRLQGTVHIEPRAIAHLSLLLSLMALERAWAYYFVDRFALEISSNGYVQGAGYTDVHVRLPAMELLAIVSLVAFVVLAFNVYQRTWTLPATAVGIWALLALAVGVIYPSIIQAFRVTPAQSTEELPYIQRNINATRYAMGIDNVSTESFPASQDLTPAVLNRYSQLLSDVQLWDPVYSFNTFSTLQQEFNYYSLTQPLAVDRYSINGTTQPVVIGVREVNTSGIPSQTWVNTHLQYTHGYGAVVAQSDGNETTSAGGTRPFLVQDVPLASTSVPALNITQPDVYFAPGDSQYVVVDSKQSEVEYQSSNSGNTQTVHYKGSGGVPLSNLADRLAYAIHLHDFNLLISNDVTSKSKLILIPDVRTEVQTAFPFLHIDANPYPVIDNGKIDWMIDGYTESDSFPYAENAATAELPFGSGLGGTYNYVRDAVKIEVNAYTGKMTLYAMSPSDPILRAWEAVFPGLVHPLAQMDSTLQQHLRYPQDLLSIQAATYGTYHVTQATTFYRGQNAWDLSPTATGLNGSPSAQLPTGANGLTLPYQPIYEMTELKGDTEPTFRSVEPLIRLSSGNFQNLTSLFFANSNQSGYGGLTAYDTTGTTTIGGPGLASSVMNANPTVSQALTLLDSKGSSVTLGTVQIIPVADSLLYVRPLYVSSSQTNYPLLEDVVVLYGKQVSMAPTLGAALQGIFGSAVSQPNGPGSSSSGTVPNLARVDISQAETDFKNAQTALSFGNLGTYQSDLNAAGQEIAAANQLLANGKSTVTPSTKSTTATTKKSAVKLTPTTAPISTTSSTSTTVTLSPNSNA